MQQWAPVPLERQWPSTATEVYPSGSAIELIQQYTSEETEFELQEQDK